MTSTQPRLSPGGALANPLPWRVALILLGTVAALYFRRPDQFHYPYIWVEDGTIGLVQYIEGGWTYLFEPVAGYLILPAKLIQMLALAMSLDFYPEIAMALTVAFHAAVLAIIASSPTSLRYPLACALFTLLLPTDSEVFGTSLYAFWWGSLLLLPPLLWSRQHEHVLWPRVAMVVVGGLSSPMVIAIVPLFLLHAVVRRTRGTAIVAAAAASCAVVQFYLLRTSGTHGTTLPAAIDPLEVVAKFFGMFLHWSPSLDAAMPSAGLVLGIVLIALLLLALVVGRHRLGWQHVVIVLALCASVAVSVTRVPPEITHPVLAGPRYFFYPYIFLGWLIIELAAVSARPLAAVLVLCLVASLHQFVAYGPRGHAFVDWRAEVARCLASNAAYPLPVHLTGNPRDMWTAQIPAGGCRHLQERSLFR